jgi:hypothetical protein
MQTLVFSVFSGSSNFYCFPKGSRWRSRCWFLVVAKSKFLPHNSFQIKLIGIVMATADKKNSLANNKNAQVRGQFAAMLRRITTQNPQRLETVALKLLEEAEEGNMVAIKELFDRLDGRAVQATEISGPEGGPIETTAANNFTQELLKEILTARQKEQK